MGKSRTSIVTRASTRKRAGPTLDDSAAAALKEEERSPIQRRSRSKASPDDANPIPISTPTLPIPSSTVDLTTINKNHRNNDTTVSSAPIQLIFILSPAKTMNVTPLTRNQPIPWTKPSCNISKSQSLVTTMKQLSKSSLQKLLHISETLAITAKQYWDQMTIPTTDSGSTSTGTESTTTSTATGKPCIFTFQGAAYQGLDIDSLVPNTNDEDHDDNDDNLAPLRYLQDTLRIIDPLYGWLRPMDEIQPYRLEMATRNILLVDIDTNDDTLYHHEDDNNKGNKTTKTKSSNKKNGQKAVKLHEYWKPSIQASIRNEEGGEGVGGDNQRKSIVIVNLASEEYSIAVEHTPIIHVVFRHEGQVIGIHAKRARGLMVRYCAKNQIQSISKLVHFAEEGYRYQPKQSNANTMVFDRSKNWNTGKK